MPLGFSYGGVNPFSTNYLYETAFGRIENVSNGFFVGQNNKVGTTSFESVIDQGGHYTYLTANTQLYVSSSDPLDTEIEVLMQGLDDEYNPIVLTATTDGANGQVQVPLSSATSFRTDTFFVSGNKTPVGELYLAEIDTLSGGVPIDPTKIKAKIPFSTDVNGDPVDTGTEFASDNFSHLGIISVPAGKRMAVNGLILATGKDDNIKIGGRLRPPGGAFKWFNRNPVPVYQSNIILEFKAPIIVPEKYDLNFMAIAGSPDSLAQVQGFFTLEDM